MHLRYTSARNSLRTVAVRRINSSHSQHCNNDNTNNDDNKTMLPSHLLDPTKKRNEPLSHTRLGQPPSMNHMGGPPSLCVTGAMCQQGRWIDPNDSTISIFYCIFRPRQLHSHAKPPLVIVHGGPSIPSNYLMPIVNVVQDRTIIYWDQWGCGKSSRPDLTRSNEKFPMEKMVQHLHALITQEWKLQSYHLFGHSFGGILAYEYLRSKLSGDEANQGCRSVILASTPTSASLVDKETKRLYTEVNKLEGKYLEEIQLMDKSMKRGCDQIFHQTFECRLSQQPLALIDALAQAGPTSWRGIQAIKDYDALSSATTSTTSNNNDDKDNQEESSRIVSNIPCLLLRGEYDFCTSLCTGGWDDIFVDPKPVTTILTNCSHYGMLENENVYGKAMNTFLHQQEKV